MASEADYKFLDWPHGPHDELAGGWGHHAQSWHHIGRRGERMTNGEEVSGNMTARVYHGLESAYRDTNVSLDLVQPFTYFIHPQYNDCKADLAIITAGRYFLLKDGRIGTGDPAPQAYKPGSRTRPFVVFKVHKSSLLEASPGSSAFHVAVAEASVSDSRLDGIPCVWLPEQQDVVRAILDSFQHTCPSNILGEHLLDFNGWSSCIMRHSWSGQADLTPASKCDQYFEWQFVREVWDAAQKYDLHLLGAYAAGVLSLRLPVLRQTYAMELLSVAKQREAESLAQQLKQQLAETKPGWDFTPSELAIIGTEDLLAHWALGEERLRMTCQKLKVQFDYARSNKNEGTITVADRAVICLEDLASLLGLSDFDEDSWVPETAGYEAATMGLESEFWD